MTASEALNMNSSMSIGWDPATKRPRVDEISQDQLDGLRTHCDEVLDLLRRCRRRGWPELKHFSSLDLDGPWLTAADSAISTQVPLWCDDASLRGLCRAEGGTCFGTIDLLNALRGADRISGEQMIELKATLLSHYYVDLGFDVDVMRKAAEIDAWHPRGAAFNLTREQAWPNADATVDLHWKLLVTWSPAISQT